MADLQVCHLPGGKFSLVASLVILLKCTALGRLEQLVQCVRAYVRVCMHVCMHVCVHVCMHVCVRACEHVCVCVFLHIRIFCPIACM